MYRSRILAIPSCFVLALALQPLEAQADGYPETQMSIQGGWSAGGIYREFEVPFWTEHLPSITDGAFSASITSLDEVGLSGEEIFNFVGSGVVDIGTTVLTYAAGEYPANEGPDLAGVARDIDLARSVVEAWSPFLEELYAPQNVMPLIYYPAEAQVFWCNAPIEGLDDLSGKRVRTFNITSADFVEAVGGSSVTMSFGEVLPALERGVIDCAITGTFSGYSASWYEAATHMYVLPMGWSVFAYLGNIERWNGLDENLRTLLSDELDRLQNEIWENAALRTQEGIDCATGNADACTSGDVADMTLVEVTDADMETLLGHIENVVLPRFGARCGAECVEAWNAEIGPLVGYEIEG